MFPKSKLSFYTYLKAFTLRGKYDEKDIKYLLVFAASIFIGALASICSTYDFN
jgi:hypothetical protein